MAKKYVGLDLGTHEVKMVLISAGLRSVQILDVAVEPLGERSRRDDIGASLDVGLAMLRRRGWHHYPVGVVLPGSAASYRVLKFPFGDARRIAQALAFEAEGQFPVPLEELEFDHIPIATGPTGQALMVAVRREVVERVQAGFTVAGVELKLITMDAIAAAQVLDSAIPELVKTDANDPRTAVMLLVDIGHHSTDLVAVGPKGPLAARVLRRGGAHVTRALQDQYRLDLAGAELSKRENAFLPHHGQGELSPAQHELAGVVARAIEPIVREVEHTRLWLRAEFGLEVTQLRLGGGGSHLRGLDAYLGEQIGLPVVFAKPRDNLGVRGFRDHDWASSTAALGAAIGCARRPLIQLYRDNSNVRGGGDGSWLVERMATVATIGFSVLVLAAIDTRVKVSALESERLARTQELSEASVKVFDEPLTDVESIRARLDEVDGEDITNVIPHRGAVEVFGAFVKATTPIGPKPAPVVEAPVSEGDEDSDVASPEPVVAAPLPSVELSAGITWDDELWLSNIEIRPKALQFRASATRSSAQDRLKARLMSQVPCMRSFPIARMRDENQRKVFDPTIEHECYFASLEAET